jgi:hypothetical protein
VPKQGIRYSETGAWSTRKPFHVEESPLSFLPRSG